VGPSLHPKSASKAKPHLSKGKKKTGDDGFEMGLYSDKETSKKSRPLKAKNLKRDRDEDEDLAMDVDDDDDELDGLKEKEKN
jgi:hypothetical protein